MAQQRDTIKELSPPWLTSGTAERYMYNFGLAADALLEKLNQAMRAHMPGAGTQTALVFIGNDRVIQRGLVEDGDTYARRLTEAYDSWQHAGSRRAILEQVLAYLNSPDTPHNGQPLGAIVGGTTPDWDLYYEGDDRTLPPVHIVPAAHQFDWDGDSSRWWRAWLVLYFAPKDLGRTGAAAFFDSVLGFGAVQNLTDMTADDVGRILVTTGAATSQHNGAFRIEEVISATHVTVSCACDLGPDANDGAISWAVKEFPTVKPGPAWGAPGAVWGDPARSWGLDNPPGVMAGVAQILAQWQSAHSFYLETILIFGMEAGVAGENFSPYSAPGTGNPDGTWAHFSKISGGASVPARVFTGIPSEYAKFNCFAGRSK